MYSAQSLTQFLVSSKISGYATAGEGGEIDRSDSVKELTYCDGDFRYLDRYVGFSPFSGMETVWYRGNPVWSMTYYGAVTSQFIVPLDVYFFLKKAMARVTTDRPYRGPESFHEGDFSYRDQFDGSVDRFSGIERIFYRGEEVYSLQYLGGVIRLKDSG
jgi:Domain of unknown function (DUF5680)